MPIRNAILLLSAIEKDSVLRDNIYRCSNGEELETYINSLGYVFDSSEFEDAVNHLHLKCQSYEMADLLMQKAAWVRLQLFENQSLHEDNSCHGCSHGIKQ
jgi:hypothetical protein